MVKARYVHRIRRRQGYTLVELVMVLVIAATLAAIAAPRFAAASARNRTVAAASRIEADLRLAQQRARASSAEYAVSFNIARDTYKLGAEADAHNVDIGASPYESDIESADFGGDGVVRFNAFGVPDTGGTLRVVGGGVALSVTLDAGTGEVTVR